jgi:hypothetical protein
LACAKDLTISECGGQVQQPVQYGRESAHKSRALGNHSSLGVTSARRSTRPSGWPERSQQLQILSSLDRKAILQRFRPLFLLRNIGGCLVFFYAPRFWHPPKILEAPRWFWHLSKILEAPRFWHLPKILEAPSFGICQRF